MKSDNQHLDFLISQYTDGTLDAASRKLVEQQLARDPSARALYKEHRDVQDVLDDFGNRIPLIDWHAFDAQLAQRLEREDAAARRTWRFGRILRPLTAAAALGLAALVGYTWHGWTLPTGAGGTLATHPVQQPTPTAVATVEHPANTAARADANISDAPASARVGTATASVAPAAPVVPVRDDVATTGHPSDAPRVALDMVRHDHTDAQANAPHGTITGGSVTPARDAAETYP